MSFMPVNFNVWAEIPVRNLDAAIAFYEAATGGKLSVMEMNGIREAAFVTDGRGVSANLFEGAPGSAETGPVVFLAAEGTVEEMAHRAAAAGGRVLGEPVTIPPGRFIYVADPDGNRIGLFEPAA